MSIDITPDKLHKRISDIGHILKEKDDALALIALGSIDESDRLDKFSDVDFFVIVIDGTKKHYLDNLDWLKDVYEVSYYFKNTEDGYKFFFEDGIYGEFAVFELKELDIIDRPKGRVIWQSSDIIDINLEHGKGKTPQLKSMDIEFHLNEALTNIYVGLMRYQRGEKLSAYRFIETYAFENILKVLHHFESEKGTYFDAYGIERRFEIHYPKFSLNLNHFLMGYDHILTSAYHLFVFIDSIYPMNAWLKSKLMTLLDISKEDDKGKIL
ncbi:MAG: hypothetical protein ACNA7K_02590 [Acholeplasmataceae bacterium]